MNQDALIVDESSLADGSAVSLRQAVSTMPSADHACARCRDKKIRCGREKEQCVNCRRDGAECEYKSPRRVNHVKLLYVETSFICTGRDAV